MSVVKERFIQNTAIHIGRQVGDARKYTTCIFNISALIPKSEMMTIVYGWRKREKEKKVRSNGRKSEIEKRN